MCVCVLYVCVRLFVCVCMCVCVPHLSRTLMKNLKYHRRAQRVAAAAQLKKKSQEGDEAAPPSLPAKPAQAPEPDEVRA
ncbi:MAG: hypothetical protein P4L40_14080 [Terracidiphilus sp.]|nr:hypothetical protein [Terracidiphilus sp.]